MELERRLQSCESEREHLTQQLRGVEAEWEGRVAGERERLLWEVMAREKEVVCVREQGEAESSRLRKRVKTLEQQLREQV